MRCRAVSFDHGSGRRTTGAQLFSLFWGRRKQPGKGTTLSACRSTRYDREHKSEVDRDIEDSMAMTKYKDDRVDV